MEGRKWLVCSALALGITCCVLGVVPAASATVDPFRALGPASARKPAKAEKQVPAPARSAASVSKAPGVALAITRIPAAPETLRQLGVKKALQSFEFNDAAGSHVLVLTREYSKRSIGSGPLGDSEEIIDLAARLFTANAVRGWQEDCKIRDGERCISLDIAAEFSPQATSITDLDSDGIAEATVAYHSMCAGDVGPHTVKVIMREQGEKYAVRGESFVNLGKGQSLGGEHRFDPPAETLPPAFRKHLTQVWRSVYRLPTCHNHC